MKIFFNSLFVLLLITTIGCNEQITTPDNFGIYEKRIPIFSRDTTKKIMPLQRAIECLNLTREQRLIADSILKEGRVCSIECKKEFESSLNIIREEYKTKMQKYREIEKTDEIKKEIELITFEYRQIKKDLFKEYKDKMKSCENNILTDIEAILRLDQHTLFNLWKATGKIPCERVKP
jgi:hypothetical protein